MLRRLATLSACAVALALLSPATAHAETRTLVDARGDVWAMDTPEAGQNTQVPQREQGDIVRTIFRHTDRAVVIRSTFAELDRVGFLSLMVVKLRTNTGAVHWMALWAGPTRDTNRWRGEVTRRNGVTPMKCASHRIDYDANVAEIRIPRFCLGSPRWVQGSLAAGTVSRDSTFFADNPVNDGPSVRLPEFTTRISRG
jgi:hypothetical protein